MYANIPGTGRGFFEGVCTPSTATTNLRDPPHPQHERTGAPLPGLRLEEDHAPCYRERRFSLG
jgi:hypothetical protein